MTAKMIIPTHYEFETGDDKPTGVKFPVTTLRDILTNAMWITYDGGANWILADKRMRLVTEAGAFIDLVTALTAMEALKTYEFAINGVNFNGYARMKSLMLDADARDGVPKTLKDGGSNYKPPGSTIFIAFQACIWNQQLAMVGRIGEGTGTADEAITKEVLKLSNGTQAPFMTPCYGVFTAGKFITAEAEPGGSSYNLKTGSVLYGAEIDI